MKQCRLKIAFSFQIIYNYYLDNIFLGESLKRNILLIFEIGHEINWIEIRIMIYVNSYSK